jgi:hypothetical protein
VVKTDSDLMPLADILNQTIPHLLRPQLEAATKALRPPSFACLSRARNTNGVYCSAGGETARCAADAHFLPQFSL